MAKVADQFVANRQDRCPLVLVLDTSSSMETEDRITQLNEGLKLLRDELSGDPLTSLRVQIAIVTFDDEARLAQDFVDAGNFQPPTLSANGLTAMGKAMDLALDLVEKQKQVIRAQNLSYYRPWIWLMSDGEPNDNDWEAAAARVRAAERAKKAVVYGVGIGAQAKLDVLGQFASEAKPLRLQPGKFGEMFKWLSRSVATHTGKSKPIAPTAGEGGAATTAAGEQISFESPLGWGVAR